MRLYLFCVVALAYLGYSVASQEASWGPKCPICYDSDIALCPKVTSSATCEVVYEPNCGCCKMCAKRRGETCGAGKGLCASGMKCVPTKSASKSLGSLLEAYMGKLICLTKEDLRQNFPQLFSIFYEDDKETLPDIPDETIIIPHQVSPPKGFSKPRVSRPPAAPVSFLHRPEPCYDHYDQVWSQEYFLRHDWVPECDRNGFYEALQCELTHGLVFGRCWCVNRHGRAISGFLANSESTKKSDCATYILELNL